MCFSTFFLLFSLLRFSQLTLSFLLSFSPSLLLIHSLLSKCIKRECSPFLCVSYPYSPVLLFIFTLYSLALFISLLFSIFLFYFLSSLCLPSLSSTHLLNLLLFPIFLFLISFSRALSYLALFYSLLSFFCTLLFIYTSLLFLLILLTLHFIFLSLLFVLLSCLFTLLFSFLLLFVLFTWPSLLCFLFTLLSFSSESLFHPYSLFYVDLFSPYSPFCLPYSPFIITLLFVYLTLLFPLLSMLLTLLSFYILTLLFVLPDSSFSPFLFTLLSFSPPYSPRCLFYSPFYILTLLQSPLALYFSSPLLIFLTSYNLSSDTLVFFFRSSAFSFHTDSCSVLSLLSTHPSLLSSFSLLSLDKPFLSFSS